MSFTKIPILHRNIHLSLCYMSSRKFIPKGLRPFLEQKIIYGISPKAYDLYMSLGENCLPATTLKHVNLRKFSGPFDWIAKSCFEDRILLVESNFKDSLNYEDLVFDLEKKTDKRHNACSVKNLRTGFIYPHDFQDDTNECFLKQQNKYNRRQERMYSLSKGANALFLYCDFGTGLKYSDYSLEIQKYFKGMQRLQSKLETKSITLILGVRADPGIEANFADLYDQGSLKLLVQPVPSKYIDEGDDMFNWPSVFLKRALRVATDIARGKNR